MNRRHFLGTLALSAFGQPAAPRVNAARLRQHLEELSVFGRPAGGTFADGVSRVAYSDADVAGRAYVMKLMEGAGLKPRIDAAGNIFGRRAGTEDSLPPVLFGSHIDSVPNGGNFDGDLGIAGRDRGGGDAERGARHHAPPARSGGVAERGRLRFQQRPGGQPRGGGTSRSGRTRRRVERREEVRRHPQDRRRSGAHRRSPPRRRVRSPATWNCISNRAARWRRAAWTSAWWKASSPSTGTTWRSAASPTTPALRRWRSGTTPWSRPRTSPSRWMKWCAANRARRWGRWGSSTVSPNVPNIVPGTVRLVVELRDLSSKKIAGLAEKLRTRAREIAANTQDGDRHARGGASR